MTSAQILKRGRQNGVAPFDPTPFIPLTRGLAPKQFQCLVALASGKTRGEIAFDQGVSLNAVGDQARRMFKALNLDKPHETRLVRLTRIAVAAGLVEV